MCTCAYNTVEVSFVVRLYNVRVPNILADYGLYAVSLMLRTYQHKHPQSTCQRSNATDKHRRRLSSTPLWRATTITAFSFGQGSRQMIFSGKIHLRNSRYSTYSFILIYLASSSHRFFTKFHTTLTYNRIVQSLRPPTRRSIYKDAI